MPDPSRLLSRYFTTINLNLILPSVPRFEDHCHPSRTPGKPATYRMAAIVFASEISPSRIISST